MGLENLGVEIDLKGIGKVQIHKIETTARKVSGYYENSQRLQIGVNRNTEEGQTIDLINFKGYSPLRAREQIRALIYPTKEKLPSWNAIYLAVLDELGHVLREDWMEDYAPLHSDALKMGIVD